MKYIILVVLFCAGVPSIPLYAGKKKLQQANHKLIVAQELLRSASSKENTLSKKLEQMSEVTAVERAEKERVHQELLLAIEDRKKVEKEASILQGEVKELLELISEKDKKLDQMREKQAEIAKKNKMIATKLQEKSEEHQRVLSEKERQQRDMKRLQEKLAKLEEERILQEGISKNKQKVFKETLTQLQRRSRDAASKNEQNEHLKQEIARVKQAMALDVAQLQSQKKAADCLAKDLAAQVTLLEKVRKSEAKQLAQIAAVVDKKEQELAMYKKSQEALVQAEKEWREFEINEYEKNFAMALAGEKFALETVAHRLAILKARLEDYSADRFALLARIIAVSKGKIEEVTKTGSSWLGGWANLPQLLRDVDGVVALIDKELEHVKAQIEVYSGKEEETAYIHTALQTVAMLFSDIETKSKHQKSDYAAVKFFQDMRSRLCGSGKLKNPLRANAVLTSSVITGFLSNDFGLNSVFLPTNAEDTSALACMSALPK